MIKYIPYHQIDKDKYDLCVLHSQNRRAYAQSWYLDCVNKEWDLLIEADYEYVMPLPRKVKYGIGYINSPAWVQQLGVFSRNEISEQKVYEFIRAIPKKFFWIDYQINSSVQLSSESLIAKKNYTLSLKKKFDDILDDYNTNRRRISKKSFEGLDLDKSGDPRIFLSHYKKQTKPYDLNASTIDQLDLLYQSNNDKVRVWNVFHRNEFIGGLIWVYDTDRIIYLAPLSGEKAKKLHVPTFIINELIKEFQGTDILLDFEGSMIPGVEKFYQSFGAKAETYYYYRKRIIGYV